MKWKVAKQELEAWAPKVFLPCWVRKRLGSMVACEWNGFYISRIDADCEKKRQKKKGSKQEVTFKLGKGRSQKTVGPGDMTEEDAAKEAVRLEERDLRSKAKKDRQRAKSERAPKNRTWCADDDEDRFVQQTDPSLEATRAMAKAAAQAKREKREAELSAALAEKEELELLQAEAQNAALAVAHKWQEGAVLEEEDVAVGTNGEHGAINLDEWEIV